VLKHASRSRHIDPDRPPAAAGGLRSQVPDLSFMALGRAARLPPCSCSRLVDENGPAPSTGGRRRASTWQLQLSHTGPSEPQLTSSGRASLRARSGYIVQTAQRRGATMCGTWEGSGAPRAPAGGGRVGGGVGVGNARWEGRLQPIGHSFARRLGCV